DALLRTDPAIASIAFYSPAGKRLAAAGSPDAVAPRSAPLTGPNGRRVGTLSLSVTYPDEFVREVQRISGREASIFRPGPRLAAKIDEVERKRRELEETIRRVGDAFASGLNPQQVAELTIQSALDACEAKAGRVLALDARVFSSISTGALDGTLAEALVSAEKA